MKDVLLFGVNELSDRVDYYIEHGDSVKPMSVKGFVIDDAYYKESSFAGKKVYRYSEAKENLVGKVSVIVCIGYSNMNENRKKIFYRLQDDGWDISEYISSRSTIETDDIGQGNILLGDSFIGVKSHIGMGNIFDGGQVSHHSKVGNFNFFTSNTVGGNLEVGDCCFFGMLSCVANGIKIHDNTLIGAGCYLNKSTEKPGLCYAAPSAVLLGRSEVAVRMWMAK